MESSAKTKIHVTEAFHELVREIKKWRKEYGKEEKGDAPKKRKGCLIL